MATVAIVKVIADTSTFLAIDSISPKGGSSEHGYNVLFQSGLAVVDVLIFLPCLLLTSNASSFLLHSLVYQLKPSSDPL